MKSNAMAGARWVELVCPADGVSSRLSGPGCPDGIAQRRGSVRQGSAHCAALDAAGVAWTITGPREPDVACSEAPTSRSQVCRQPFGHGRRRLRTASAAATGLVAGCRHGG
jgi:hypothetical protein